MGTLPNGRILESCHVIDYIVPYPDVEYIHVLPCLAHLGKSFQGHADELERSFMQLTRMTVNKENPEKFVTPHLGDNSMIVGVGDTPNLS